MRNKRGQGMFLQIFIAIFIWVGGILALPLLEDVIDGARTGLQCSFPALISDGTKLLCLVTDTGSIMLIWTIISICGGLILGKIK